MEKMDTLNPTLVFSNIDFSMKNAKPNDQLLQIRHYDGGTDRAVAMVTADGTVSVDWGWVAEILASPSDQHKFAVGAAILLAAVRDGNTTPLDTPSQITTNRAGS